jgi:hypothetical protein
MGSLATVASGMCVLITATLPVFHGPRFHQNLGIGNPLSGIVGAMRPFTAIAVIGLLVLIIGAFVAKLVSTGLTP